MMEYANVDAVRHQLSLGAREREPIYMVIPAEDVEAALAAAKDADAVKITRCRDCFWCVAGKREPICLVPGRPAFHTSPDGYCQYGRPKGGCRYD